MAQIIDEYGVATGEKPISPPSVPGSRMMQVLQKIYFHIGMTGEGAVIILMMITATHVLARYFFQSPLKGLTEVSIFLLTIAIFLLGPFSQSLDGHIKVDVITSKFSKRTRAIITTVNSILCIVYLIPSIWQTFIQARFLQEGHTETNILDLPVYTLTYLIAVSWILLLVIVLAQIIGAVQSLRKGGRP